MIDDRLDNIQRSPMKEAIERAYFEADEHSGRLRDIIMARVPGSREIEYRAFIRYFGKLFDKTKNKSDIDMDVMNACKKWFHTPRATPSKNNIMKGLKLYDNYVTELFIHKLLKYE